MGGIMQAPSNTGFAILQSVAMRRRFFVDQVRNGHAEIAGFPDDVGAERRTGDVADPRDEVQDHVQPDRLVDAGNDEQSLEQLFHRFDALANRRRVRAQAREGQALVTGNGHHSLPAGCCRSVSV